MKIKSYYQPKSLEEGLSILNNYEKVKIVAGGTDLLVKIKNNKLNNDIKGLVSFNKLNLDEVIIREDNVYIGSYCTMASIANNKVIKEYFPALALAASEVGSIQIQNMATIGGNIANASPAGDTIPPLYTLDAELELVSFSSSRKVKIVDFFTGPGKTLLKENEIIKNIILPLRKTKGLFIKVGERKAHAISKVSVAVSKSINNNDREIIFAFGAVAPTVVKMEVPNELENYIDINQMDKSLEDYIKKIDTIINPIDDIRSTKFYRTRIAKELFKKALFQIFNKF